MATAIESARQLTYHAAQLKDASGQVHLQMREGATLVIGDMRATSESYQGLLTTASTGFATEIRDASDLVYRQMQEGTSTLWIICCTTSSGVPPSISRSGVSMMRWRSTLGARNCTSSASVG